MGAKLHGHGYQYCRSPSQVESGAFVVESRESATHPVRPTGSFASSQHLRKGCTRNHAAASLLNPWGSPRDTGAGATAGLGPQTTGGLTALALLKTSQGEGCLHYWLRSCATPRQVCKLSRLSAGKIRIPMCQRIRIVWVWHVSCVLDALTAFRR